jgi:hypothetical protein
MLVHTQAEAGQDLASEEHGSCLAPWSQEQASGTEWSQQQPSEAVDSADGTGTDAETPEARDTPSQRIIALYSHVFMTRIDTSGAPGVQT